MLIYNIVNGMMMMKTGILVLSLLMSGLKFCMTTPVIIDDKYVSVNAVSFGAHFVS
jgi:hypothetical protein